MPRDTRRHSELTPTDIARFERVSGKFDPTNSKQLSTWERIAQRLSDGGWTPAQVIGRLWEIRPEFRTEGLTPEAASEIVLREQADTIIQQRAAAMEVGIGVMPTMDQLRFDAAVIQHAALISEQVVVRGRVRSVNDLPPEIPEASRRRPLFLDPAEQARFEVAQDMHRR